MTLNEQNRKLERPDDEPPDELRPPCEACGKAAGVADKATEDGDQGPEADETGCKAGGSRMTVVVSNYARQENDLYQTEPWATKALLRHFPIEPDWLVWEPAAGNHLIADVISEAGAKVFTSGIVTYDREHGEIFDFLNGISRRSCHAIITNPPYGNGNRDAAKFERLALQRCPAWVALLLTAKFDFGKTRANLFGNNPRFATKIALVDRIQWFPGDCSGTEDHAWYVWGPAPGSSRGPKLLYAGR